MQAYVHVSCVIFLLEKLKQNHGIDCSPIYEIIGGPEVCWVETIDLRWHTMSGLTSKEAEELQCLSTHGQAR